MKVVPPPAVAAMMTAFYNLYQQDATLVKRCMSHLTPTHLKTLQEALRIDFGDDKHDTAFYRVLAIQGIRSRAYQSLEKFQQASKYTSNDIKDALEHHVLPAHIVDQLMGRRRKNRHNNNELNDPSSYGSIVPKTWKDELDFLWSEAQQKTNPKEWLWRQLSADSDHPMTNYQPVQCPNCDTMVPDEYDSKASSQKHLDELVGLKEIEATGDELELRSGWFRGPRTKVVFEITCTHCAHVYTWYRSGHPKMWFNPHHWGRLCGEQEDLRLTLAQSYLDIPIRLILPLDWDHVWTEVRLDNDCNNWKVVDDPNASNFACRLDEGIGSWTGIWAIHPNDPDHCEDVTSLYLSSSAVITKGRLDDEHADNLPKWRQIVQEARQDASCRSTQAGTGWGYVLAQAGFESNDVTAILQQAVIDYQQGLHWFLATINNETTSSTMSMGET